MSISVVAVPPPRRHNARMPGRLSVRALLLAAGLLAALVATTAPREPQAPAATSFAGLVDSLSEPGGYFDTDNLISNEGSYQSVLPALRRLGPGGAYVGVGPDQNFSYIAALRPSAAFIVDIRRDNLLLHLLFKALFAAAPTRIEYLALLTGRPLPPDPGTWHNRTTAALADYVDTTPPIAASQRQERHAMLATRMATFGVSLSDADVATIRRFHERFATDGLTLRFQSLGRPPQYYYPTYRQLLLATDGEGREGNFLASDEAYGVVRALQLADAVVPVTGNLAGSHALRAVAAHLRARGLRVRAIYTSNVEFYLYRDGSLRQFVANVKAMPLADDAVLIRSEFGGGSSTSSLEPIAAMLESWTRADDRRRR
jgi:hypothetical protein